MHRCRKCGSRWLFSERVAVLDGKGFAQLLQCRMCGDIYKERIDSALPLRELNIDDLKNNQRTRGCSVDGCISAHHCKGLCRQHYQQAYRGNGHDQDNGKMSAPAV